MRIKWLQVSILIGLLVLEMTFQQTGTVVAKAPERTYEIRSDAELVNVAMFATGGEDHFSDSAYYSEGTASDTTVISSVEIAEHITKWRADKAQKEEAERIRKQREIQEKKLKQMKEEKRKERIRKARLARLRKEKARRKAIEKKCGKIRGTETEEVLCRIVEAEAGGEDLEGRMLVANVVLNRVINKHFPNSVRGVVFAHRGSRYQFSPVSNGSYYSVHVSKGTKKAVREALKGKDTSQGALYFMERALAESGNVSWFDRCLTRLFRHGCHEFYK
ncbi:MAG: cell wall hydrolase [Lachnospiraceae bacterium]|nr:cell wall hydrolase [Lachnospiraceae bacterium]